MAQINFYIRKDMKSNANTCVVSYSLTLNNKRHRKTMGFSVKEKYWSEVKQRVKPNIKTDRYNLHKEYNSFLDKSESAAKEIFHKYALSNKKLTYEIFQKEWNLSNYNNQPSTNFITEYDRYIEISKPIRAKRTIMGHTTTLNFIKDFEIENKLELTLENFDIQVFESFRNYSFTKKQITDNYFNTITSKIKAFMTWAYDREIHQNLAYKKFKAPERQKDIICLYNDELFKLYNHQFKSKKLEKVKDVYCFGCFTGLRYSDIIDLKKEHLINGEIQKTIIKTREFSRIPLNRFAQEIIDKYLDYPFGLLPTISEPKFNEYIKVACKEAKIDSPVNITRYSGGKVHNFTKPKYDLITSHTARKTFTTNSLIRGMNETIVKKITGHKKDENFRRYVKLADDLVKQASNDAWDKE